jgi:thioredoxin reductase
MAKKIIIVGAGIAGLSTGCYALMNGYEAEIYEMHKHIPCRSYGKMSKTMIFIYWNR